MVSETPLLPLTYNKIHHPEKHLHCSPQERALVQGPPAFCLVIDEREDEGDDVVSHYQFPVPPPVYVCVQGKVSVYVDMVADSFVVQETIKLVYAVQLVRVDHGDVVMVAGDLVDDGDQGGEVV